MPYNVVCVIPAHVVLGDAPPNRLGDARGEVTEILHAGKELTRFVPENPTIELGIFATRMLRVLLDQQSVGALSSTDTPVEMVIASPQE